MWYKNSTWCRLYVLDCSLYLAGELEFGFNIANDCIELILMNVYDRKMLDLPFSFYSLKKKNASKETRMEKEKAKQYIYPGWQKTLKSKVV